ncbi:hypothetical protein BDR06DRAFT_1002884 [Suillus hirtellus]|nr:hypothetical protein BDR06DRAFT_1002884 [Suillus hirtellus]
MTEDHRQEPLPEVSQSREATVGENSVRALIRPLSTSANDIVAASYASLIQSQHRSGCGLGHAVRKVKKNVTKKVSKRFKRSRHQVPIVQNTDHESVLLNQNTEHASSLHPSDGDKPVTSENLTGRGNQGTSGESASKVFTPNNLVFMSKFW